MILHIKYVLIDEECEKNNVPQIKMFVDKTTIGNTPNTSTMQIIAFVNERPVLKFMASLFLELLITKSNVLSLMTSITLNIFVLNKITLLNY